MTLIDKSSPPIASRRLLFHSPFLAGFLIILSATAILFPASPGEAREYTGQPLNMFTTELFTGSGRCAVCHDLLVDGQGESISIANYWRSTMMANASKDPFWQAKMVSEIERHPALKKVIEQKCISCHMPMAEVEAERTGQPIDFSPGFADQDHKLHNAAMDGVSCSLCHQIQPDNLGLPQSFSGKYTVDKETKKPARKIFGPFLKVDQRTMRTSVGYTPMHGKHIKTSGLCATCHTLYTPFVDVSGKILGTFPEQTPYQEWQESTYSRPGKDARTCQQCHMPLVDGKVKIARYAPSGVHKRANFALHNFVGGNIFMLRLMKNNVQGLQLTASSADLANTLQRTEIQLQKHTAELEILKAEAGRGTLLAEIEVKSLVGHKYPSGIPGRRAWLHFLVEDSGGKIIFESGKPDKDGSITGNDNDSQTATYEPHYNRITRQEQVQIYESIMADSDGKLTYTLLRAASFLKDNRILPAGFNKDSANADIKVSGEAAHDDNFIGGSDKVTYAVPLRTSSGPYSVRAELLYDPISPAFIVDLRKDSSPIIDAFLQDWQKLDKSPVKVAADEVQVR